ncbi:MAG: hypothetical protein ACFFCH_05680 [Promethearchaeota archaeon]
MTRWTVTLVDGSTLQLLDLQKTGYQYYELQAGFIQQLQTAIKRQPTYSVKLNLIDSTLGPNSEQLLAPFLLLLITTTKLTVTFLGELTENETGYIIGIWPPKFLRIIKSDSQAILNILYIITNQPTLVEKLDVYF